MKVNFSILLLAFIISSLGLTGCNYLSPGYRPEALSSADETADFSPGKWIRFRDLQRQDFAAKRDKNVSERDAKRFDAYVAKAVILSPYAILGIAENEKSSRGKYRLLADNFHYFAALDTENSWWSDRADFKGAEASYTLEHENIHFMIHELAARKINKRIVQALKNGYEGNDPVVLMQRFINDARTFYEEEIAQAEQSDIKFDIQTSLAFRPKTQENWRKSLEHELFAYRAFSFDEHMELRFPAALNGSVQTLQFAKIGRFEDPECVPVIQPVSLSGYRCLSALQPRLYQASTHIPAEKGNVFGVIFAPESLQSSLWTELEVLIRFPKTGVQPPDYDKPIFSYLDHVLINGKNTAGYYYHLREDWEVVPGTWVFEFYSKGKKVAEQTFELTPP